MYKYKRYYKIYDHQLLKTWAFERVKPKIVGFYSTQGHPKPGSCFELYLGLSRRKDRWSLEITSTVPLRFDKIDRWVLVKLEFTLNFRWLPWTQSLKFRIYYLKSIIPCKIEILISCKFIKIKKAHSKQTSLQI